MPQHIDVPGMGVVEFPDGMSDMDISAAIQRSMPPKNTNVAINAGNKAVAGVLDALPNAPVNLWNLVKAAVGTGATALGRSDLAPDLTPTPDYGRKLLEHGGFIKPENEPVTSGQRVLDNVVQGAVGGAVNPARSGTGMLANALTGSLSGGAAGTVKEATGSDTAALTAALLTPAAVTSLGNRATAKLDQLAAQKSQNAPRDDLVREALAAGYRIQPGEVRQPGVLGGTLESVASKAATGQDISNKNEAVTADLLRKSIELGPNAALTREATAQVRKEAYERGYTDIEKVPEYTNGRLYRDDIKALASDYQKAGKYFEGANPGVDKLVEELSVKKMDGPAALAKIKILRQDAQKAFASGDTTLGMANKAGAKAIEDQLERVLPSMGKDGEKILANFRDARQLIAKAHTVEDAIIAGGNDVNPRQMAAALQSDVPLTGEQRLVAAFANNFKKSMQPPAQTSGAGTSQLLVGGGLAAGGAAGGHFAGLDPYTSAALGAVAAQGGPMAARKLLQSDFYQNRLLPSYKSRTAAALADTGPPNFINPLLFAEELRRRGNQ